MIRIFFVAFILCVGLTKTNGQYKIEPQIVGFANQPLSFKSPFSEYQIVNKDQKPQIQSWKPSVDSIYLGSQQSLWVRYFIANQDSVPYLYYFNGKNLDYYELELKDKSGLRKARNGLFSYSSSYSTLQFLQIEQFMISPKDTTEVLLKIDLFKSVLGKNKVQLIKLDRVYTGGSQKLLAFQEKYWNNNIYELQVRSMVQGALLLITLLSGFLIFRNRGDKLFQYYFTYVLTAFLFTLFASRSYTYVGQFLMRFPLVKIYANELCLWLGLAAYFRFIAELLSLSKLKPELYNLAKNASWGAVIVGCISFIYLVLTHDTSFYSDFYIYSRIPLVGFYVYFLLCLKREVKSAVIWYVLLANIVLIAIGLLAWIKKMAFSDTPWPGIFNQIFTIPTAVLAEIVVFSLAIAYKIGEEQRQRSLLTQKLIETEMQALRSQMNPHFLYNCINSIKYYVVKNQPEQASLYLNKFSKLIRKILNNSQYEFITLEEEIQTLELYLEMEKLRFVEKMHFEIQIDPNLEISFLKIPTMLIQPFIENSIWHGLMQKQSTDGLLELSFEEYENEKIRITIKDNGVGRKMAAELKSKALEKNKSMGMTMTLARVEHLNETNNLDIKIITEDIVDASGIGQGTTVYIVMKAKAFLES